MIAGIQARFLRPHSASLGMRQQVATRTVSRRAVKPVALIACVCLVAVFGFSQVMQGRIAASALRYEELKTVRMDAVSENIGLLGAKARLVSQEYVEQRAKEKLQLVVPQQQQVRRL